ncbi:MAG: hypothetical protein WAL72_15465 [Streptosporangiaceae bacterium]
MARWRPLSVLPRRRTFCCKNEQRGRRAPGGILCREGPGRLSGLLTRNKLALENVIQVDLSADIMSASTAAYRILNDDAVPGPPSRAGQGQLAF